MESVQAMPWGGWRATRRFSFVSRFSGYWNIFDPTNGYLAIHARVLAELPSIKFIAVIF